MAAGPEAREALEPLTLRVWRPSNYRFVGGPLLHVARAFKHSVLKSTPKAAVLMGSGPPGPPVGRTRTDRKTGESLGVRFQLGGPDLTGSNTSFELWLSCEPHQPHSYE